MGFILGLLRALKLPLRLLKGWLRKRKKPTKRGKLENKLRTHIWNFSPGRLKNITWKKSDRRSKKKNSKKVKRDRKFSKKS